MEEGVASTVEAVWAATSAQKSSDCKRVVIIDCLSQRLVAQGGAQHYDLLYSRVLDQARLHDALDC